MIGFFKKDLGPREALWLRSFYLANILLFIGFAANFLHYIYGDVQFVAACREHGTVEGVDQDNLHFVVGPYTEEFWERISESTPWSHWAYYLRHRREKRDGKFFLAPFVYSRRPLFESYQQRQVEENAYEASKRIASRMLSKRRLEDAPLDAYDAFLEPIDTVDGEHGVWLNAEVCDVMVELIRVGGDLTRSE